MKYSVLVRIVLGLLVLMAGNVARSDPFTFQDDFEGYTNDADLRAVWDPDWRITLGAGGGNHYLRAQVEEGVVMKVNVWIVPSGDLTGQELIAGIRCTAINSGNAYFYIPGTPKDYRSVSGVPVSTGWVGPRSRSRISPPKTS